MYIIESKGQFRKEEKAEKTEKTEKLLSFRFRGLAHLS